MTRQGFSSPRWLTDELATYGIPVEKLAWDHKSLEMTLNRRLPKFDLDELIYSVARDLQSGLFKLTDSTGCWIPDPARSLLAKAIRENSPPDICIWFTPLGGQRWESDTQADWKRYIDHGTYGNEENGRVTWVIHSMRADRIRRFLGTLHALNHVPLPNTIRSRQISPWQATYWKTLPRCHKLTVRCEIRTDPCPDWNAVAAFRDAQTWFAPTPL